MTNTDYYELLGVSEAAGEAEIKSAYRRLALRYHPDRNDGDRQAEERFKAISEAYAVLSDPIRRRSYDLARSRGGAYSFDFNRQDVFADLLRRMAQGGFRDFGPHFASSGLRFDEAFLRQVFFSQGPFLMRGFFFAGFPGASAARGAAAGAVRPRPQGAAARLLGPPLRWILRQAGKAAFALVGLGLRRLERRLSEEAAARSANLDLTCSVAVSPEEAAAGTDLELSYQRGAGMQRVAVKVPPGTRPGATLRLSGMGLSRAGRRGDLLLVVDVASRPGHGAGAPGQPRVFRDAACAQAQARRSS